MKKAIGKYRQVCELLQKATEEPHMDLMSKLRPLLSHDQKELQVKITDKSQRQSLRAKNITIIGFPSAIFCTARLKMYEQEVTQFLLLSPEADAAKLKESVWETIRYNANKTAYKNRLDSHPGRQMLMERIRAIRDARDLPPFFYPTGMLVLAEFPTLFSSLNSVTAASAKTRKS